MRKYITILALFSILGIAKAQFCTNEYKLFNHLGVGVNAGTSGIGIEVSSTVGQYLQIRTGVDYMPKFNYKMDFGIQLGDEQGSYNPEESQQRFDKLADMLEDFTGYKPDDHVSLNGKPTFANFKFLADILPFENKNWRFTVGFYAGGANVAKAENVIEDASTLIAVNMYNNMYDKVLNEEEIFMGLEFPPDIAERFLSYGKMGMVLGTYRRDVTDENGNILHKKDEPYKMYPNKNNMVKSYIKVNKIRPYLGFGYGHSLSRDKKLNYSLDCGVMYLGKVHVYTHDGTCLSHDVKGYATSIKSYMNLFNNVSVYPVVNFKVAYRIF